MNTAEYERLYKLELYLAPLLLVTAFLAGCILFVSARALPLQWDTSQPETAVAYNALRLANTGQLYPPLQEPPYTPVAYTPVYYVILAGVAKITPSVDAVLQLGRVISLLSFVLIALIVYRWSRTAGSSVWLSLTGAAFVLSQPDAFPWTATARPDMLAILLSIGGLYLLFRSKSESAVAISGLLLSIAILTKQSAITAPVAGALWLLTQKRLRALCVLTGTTLAAVVVCVAVLQAPGEHFFSNVSYLMDAGVDPEGSRRLLAGQFGYLNGRFAVLGLAVLGAVSALVKRDSEILLPATYFVVSWCVVLGAIHHVGSNNYYFFEAWAASALIAVFGLGQLRQLTQARWLVLAVVIVATFPFARDVQQGLKLIKNDGLIRNQSLARAVRNVYVLTDVPYLAAQSRSPEMLDSYFTSILEQKQVWIPVPIIGNVSSQAYDLILVGTNIQGMRRDRGYGFLSPAVSQQMTVNYRFFCAIHVHEGLGQLGYDTINVAVPKGRRLSEATTEALAVAGCRDGTKPPWPPGKPTYAFILQHAAN